LKDAGLTAAGVGLDDVNPERFDSPRGRRGAFDDAVKALENFNQAGVFTYTNLCLTTPLVQSGDLWRYYDLVRELNVGLVEILEPRPTGGYAGRDIDDLFTASDRSIVADFVRAGNAEKRYRNYPLLFYLAEIESPEKMGCMMGGLSHFSIDSAGNVIPCVFVPIGFGNILEEDFKTIFQRMRVAIPAPIHTGCASLLLKDLIARGGTAGGAPMHYETIRKDWNTALQPSSVETD